VVKERPDVTGSSCLKDAPGVCGRKWDYRPMEKYLEKCNK